MKDGADKPVVVVNDLVALRRRSGVGFYVRELLGRLKDSGDVEVVPLSRTLAGRPLRLASRFVAGRARVRTATAGAPVKKKLFSLASLGAGWIDRYIAAARKLFRWPLFHETDHCPATMDGPLVTTVHDLSVILHPEWHPEHRVKKYEERFISGLAKSRFILTDSEAIREELIARLGVDPAKITTARLAPRPQFRPIDARRRDETLRRYGLPRRFVLFVGTIEPRKNVGALLDAYAKLSPDRRSQHPLVIVGGWGWKSDDVREKLSRSPWRDCVRLLGYVPDEDLVALFNAAAMLAYPSLYEGFGLPPIEAMACGAPVVTTHAGGLRDSVGDAAHIVDPHDVDELASAMQRVLTDTDYADRLTWRGYQRAAELSWSETAQRTVEVYRKAA